MHWSPGGKGSHAGQWPRPERQGGPLKPSSGVGLITTTERTTGLSRPRTAGRKIVDNMGGEMEVAEPQIGGLASHNVSGLLKRTCEQRRRKRYGKQYH